MIVLKFSFVCVVCTCLLLLLLSFFLKNIIQFKAYYIFIDRATVQIYVLREVTAIYINNSPIVTSLTLNIWPTVLLNHPGFSW